MAPPHLLYIYTWSPFNRRVILYLRERQIPSSHVRMVPVTAPQDRSVGDGLPPPPEGTLPILAIPPETATDDKITTLDGWKIVHGSLPILNFLESRFQALESWKSLPQPKYNMHAENMADMFDVSSNIGYQLAVETTINSWNSVRAFGSGIGQVQHAPAAKDSLKWCHREFEAVERYLDPKSGLNTDYGGYAARLAPGSRAGPMFGDILLYAFCEQLQDMYGVFDEMTLGLKDEKGQKVVTKDAFGRDKVDAGYFPNVREFFKLYKSRGDIAKRNAELGENVPEFVQGLAHKWLDGVFIAQEA